MIYLRVRASAKLTQMSEMAKPLPAGRLPDGDVAFGLGYEGTSAFIAMFRRGWGTTLSRYFEG
jgi:AraC-like DNA-binding protein